MAVTLKLRDHLLRLLVHDTPGTDDATDALGRDIQAGDLDYMGRPLVAIAWGVSTAFSAGEYTELDGGQVLKATVGGTTDDTTEPTAPGYGNTVEDGTVTWEQVTG